MAKTRVIDPQSGMTFEIEDYTGPIGPPLEIYTPIKPMPESLPRCDCGHLFEICDHPRCPHGDE